MTPRQQSISAIISPRGGLDVLSGEEVARLRDASIGGLHDLFRRCALAVLDTGNHSDDPCATKKLYPDFDIQIRQQDRGIQLELLNAPASAFVDGQIIRGVADLLFSVVRDIVYIDIEMDRGRFDLGNSRGITSAVFEILRNARILKSHVDPNLVVCWGGHSISQTEYLYTKDVGYELGLRGLDICTGCGPGAMKGPMKGATIAHAKQRRTQSRYIGVTEPGIIAAESPNPIVNNLVILPDIEKRLEAFVRLAHGIVIFPGGVGTAEEILYLLGLLLHPDNAAAAFPLIFTGPAESTAYFEKIDCFLRLVLGPDVASRYQIILDDPARVAQAIKAGIAGVRRNRVNTGDSFLFNWSLYLPPDFQQPFVPTHEAMSALNLSRNQPTHLLAANLRRAFSGIVAGNVKEDGLRSIEEFGRFEIHGDPEIMEALDDLLRAFVSQGRMKMSGDYTPCYRVLG
jgi:predicted Rossmann-fold nucleotide-binding protein